MTAIEPAIADLVRANRILASQGVVDAFGHVSIRDPRDPQRYLMSCSRSPELVEAGDIVTFGSDGEPLDAGSRKTYIERYIHAGIYEARPEINAVVHSHADEVVPYTITRQPLVPVLHSASSMGKDIPRWDIRDQFGDQTNLLVSNLAQGRDLAKRLGSARVVLMRGHGFAAGAQSLYAAVKIALFLPRNAQILTTALRFGDPIVLADGEIEALNALDDPTMSPSRRAWEYWCAKAGLTP